MTIMNNERNTTILKNVCCYSSKKIETSLLTRDNYISTENMIPNRVGVSQSSTLPNSNFSIKYEKDDILISNIRPYFKKIWKATFSGGCSADVLVFKSNSNILPDFLYYVLSNDNFFKFMMASAKGTKMPRGDKKKMMEYEFYAPSLKEQRKIASVLKSLDEKISLNTRINDNLAA